MSGTQNAAHLGVALGALGAHKDIRQVVPFVLGCEHRLGLGGALGAALDTVAHKRTGNLVTAHCLWAGLYR